jgi:hypothetical protein
MKHQTNNNKEGNMETEKDRAKDQARAQLDSIREMVTALKDAEEANDEAREEAEQTIQEDPLSVRVRSGWHNPGEKASNEEFEILLCTGGPAVRIIGELSEHNEPERAKIEFQDWFTSWMDYPLDSEEEEDVLTYCRSFYFGE